MRWYQGLDTVEYEGFVHPQTQGVTRPILQHMRSWSQLREAS